jgi:hypothetical protein
MSETATTESNLTVEVSDLKKQVRRLARLLSATETSPTDLSISQWCARRGISKSTFYLMKAAGKAPAMLKVLGTQRITPEADAAWEAARRAETAAQSISEE